MTQPNDNISLIVEGLRYEGWKSMGLLMGLDQLAGSFGFETSDRWPRQPANWRIKMGMACTVNMNEHRLIKGHIDDFPLDYTATTHSVFLAGRDATADLVDCSRDRKPNEWWDATVLTILQDLCSPFGIKVVTTSAEVLVALQRKVTSMKADEGDTIADLITRLCQMVAVLPVSFGDGNLTIVRAGTEMSTDSLELGVNIERATANQSDRDRFNRYIAKGQGIGADNKSLEEFVSPVGEATDDVIKRYRPMVLLTERATTNEMCRERADWEARRRAGDSRQNSYTVRGWLQSDGTPWMFNKLVRVKDDFVGIDGTKLISQVNFRLSPSDGTLTTLTVCDRAKYLLLDDQAPIADIKSRLDV